MICWFKCWSKAIEYSIEKNVYQQEKNQAALCFKRIVRNEDRYIKTLRLNDWMDGRVLLSGGGGAKTFETQ